MNYQEFLKNKEEVEQSIHDCKLSFEIGIGEEEYINLQGNFRDSHLTFSMSSSNLWVKPEHLIELRDKLNEVFPKEKD